MKKYIKPEIEVVKINACSLLNASMPVVNSEVDGSKALIEEWDWEE